MQHNIRGGPFLLGRSNIVVKFCLNVLMLCVHFLHCYATSYLMVVQRQVVPVKRKDLFKLLGLNDPLDIVDPTEVKLNP